MKAEVLSTGEIIDVFHIGQTIYMEGGTERTFGEDELKFLTEEMLGKRNHWEDVRERAAIAAMQSILASDAFRNAKINTAMNAGVLPEKEIAATSIRYANELVRQLKVNDYGIFSFIFSYSIDDSCFYPI